MTQLFRAILFVSLLFTHAGMAQKQRTDGAPETTAPRPHLAWDRPEYRSFALQPYTNYPNHSIPYEDAPRAVYGPMGDYLTTGYDLYSWSETRQPGQEYNAGDRNSHFAPGHARVATSAWAWTVATICRASPMSCAARTSSPCRKFLAPHARHRPQVVPTPPSPVASTA